ncbi:hypothetical protein [Saccharothrix hoggarensis]|uniref:4-amino-4-deoxy-L-arabinose transferase-like glycosyltransferase n=1 Tax=Saccharothrix hoggarensis TaxID=913853 RepID=A0ABW3QT89_9PSEU
MDAEVSQQVEPAVVTPGARRPKAHFALWAAAAIPFLLALAEAYRSPRLNFADFWGILARVSTPDGALEPAELLVLHNDHPSILVGAVFWLNGAVFGGTNYGLGFASVALVAVMLVAMVTMLPDSLTATQRGAVVLGLSLLLFSSTATEYFGIGMSGMHWLLGIVPAVVALAFAHRGHTVPALVFAVLGSMGHGAAFPVWIALAVVAWLRRDRLWRLVSPLVLGVLTLVLWSLPSRPPGFAAPMLLGFDTYLGSGLAMLGQIWSAKDLDLAFLTGAVTVGLVVVLFVGAFRERRALDGRVPHAGWFGVALLAVAVAAMIGVSRGHYGAADGLSPRYAMVALVGAAAVLVLLVARGPRLVRAKTVPIVIVVGLATFAVGNGQAMAVREKYPTQPVLAVAMRVEATGQMSRMQANPAVLPVLRSMGVYPFTPDFTLGCGGPELGSRVDLASAKEMPLPAYGGGLTTGAVEAGPVVGDSQISGWAVVDGNAADCVLVVDQSGEVVGGGAVGVPRGDIMQFTRATGRAGWVAVAAPGTADGVVLVLADGVLYRLAELG